jgi:hypothetical protein
MKINRNSYAFFLYIFFSYFFFNQVYIGNAGVNADKESVFSLELKDASFKSCLEKISKLSGYEIFVTGESIEYKISINLNNVTIEDSLTRILKGINHAMKWDDKHRKVTLFLYDRSETRNKRKKSTGLSSILSIKPEPGLPTLQNSNEYQSKGFDAGISNREYRRDNNVNLNISGANTTFVQGTPTGHFDP